VQNNIAVVTMYHYNADGSPTWNVMTGSIQTGTALAAFNGFTGGQSLTSAYRVPSAGTSVGNLRVQFNGPCEGQIQLDNLPIINVQRFAFGDLPVGQECRARTVVPAPAPTPVPAPVPVPVPVPAPAPTPAPASSAVKGKALYATYCAVCHGPSPVNNIDKVLRGANAPSIILNAINSNAGGMGILKGAISTQDASDLAAYLATPRI
jgi:mono/diheme cytochrome c family protein